MLLIVEGIGKEGAAHGRTTMQRKRQPPGRTITKSTQARHPPACLYCVARPAMRIRRFSRPQLVPIRQSNGAEPPCDAKDRHQAAEERDTKGEAADRKEQEHNNTRYYSEWRTDQRKDDDNERDDDDKKARRTRRDDKMLSWMRNSIWQQRARDALPRRLFILVGLLLCLQPKQAKLTMPSKEHQSKRHQPHH